MTNDVRQWAEAIRQNASNDGVRSVIAAINDETRTLNAKHADVIVACAQVLGQSIGAGNPGIARGIRMGILEMIDGFATQVAALEMRL